MRALPLLSALVLVLSSAAGAQETGAVSGHVFCSDSQAPCRFANVVLETAPPEVNGVPQPQQGTNRNYSSPTDLSGAFLITDVAPGDYYILARQSGYLSLYDIAANALNGGAPLPAKALDLSLTRITVAPKQTTIANLSLARGASLSGTVRYDDGAPGISLPLELYRRDSNGSWKEYQNFGGAGVLAPLGFRTRTDDRGRYYEPGLPPGFYKLKVNLPEVSVFPTSITGRQSLAIKLVKGNALQVFNGGKYRLQDAPAIELQQGEERADVDIYIPTTGLRTLSGTVTAKLSQEAVADATVRLLDPQDKSVVRETPTQNDGSFLFEYVPEGAYLVEIKPAKQPHRGTGEYAPLTSPLQVEGDIRDLSYSVAPAPR
jgi:hypothetical protein